MDFVAGISRINLIRAHSLARPKAEFEAEHGVLDGNETMVSGNDTLRQVIVKAADSAGPILVKDDGLGTEGVITRNDILKGVILGTEDS